jgi:NADH pyrophosphatase NudC (nudix superfamily)
MKRLTAELKKFIQSVAMQQGVSKTLSLKELQRANRFCGKCGDADYYYKLKEYFNN